MKKLNIDDKVILKSCSYLEKEVGTIVGIYTGKEERGGNYLVKFVSLDNKCNGWEYNKVFYGDPDYIIKPYEGYALWLDEEEIKKVESEEDIKIKFNRIREQKKEIIKEKSEKVLELTLEIKELEAEIEKIKKEYYL